jgi:hypothetical protein
VTQILPDLSYELVNPPLLQGQGFKFGRGTKIHVEKCTIGDPEKRMDDQPLARQDGVLFGRDYLGGRTIQFDINIKTPRDGVPVLYPGPDVFPSAGTFPSKLTAIDIWRRMSRSWLTEDTMVGASRLQPGWISELYIQDGETCYVTYGRPTNCQDTRGTRRQGWIPVTADFRTVTHKFYEAEWQSNTITTAPDPSTGIEFPFTFPLTTIAEFSEEDIVIVDGNTDTWMLSTVYGPILAPEIEVVGYYKIQTASDFQLGPHDYLQIDPRPWNRKIMKNGNINVAGKFTQESRRPSVQTLPPGTHKVVLRGTDLTGTARLETRWRNAWTAI